MKKLLMALLLLLYPLCAAAELPLVYPAETVVSVIPLTQAQSALVEHLYGPILAGETRIALPQGTRYDDVAPAMKSLMMDYPELFHLHRSYTVTYYQNEPETAIAVNPEYRLEHETAEITREAMYAAALEMIRENPTAEGLHDALLARVTYGGGTELRHTAAAALLAGEATCEGYAQALSLLYRMAGIPCGMITGTGTNSVSGLPEQHAWSIAWLDGYALIDATWNDQERSGYNTHWYYGLSTAQMAADHAPDSDLSVPACGEQANWHRQHGKLVDGATQVHQAVERLVTQGETVNLRIPDAALYAQIAGDMGGFLDEYNALCGEGFGFYGTYTYLTCDAQRCIILDRGGE